MLIRLFIICLAISLLPCSVYSADADLQPDLQRYTKLAEAGDAGYQHDVGAIFARGSGVKQNYTKALTWFRLAAAQGDLRAKYDLGVMYTHGYGVVMDSDTATDWFLKVVEGGGELRKMTFAELYHADYLTGVVSTGENQLEPKTDDSRKKERTEKKSIEAGNVSVVSPPVQIVKMTENVEKVMPAVAELSSLEIDKGEKETREKIKTILEKWAQAWSQKSVSAYLSFYAKDFKPEYGSRENWEKKRILSLGKPRWIRVLVEDLQLEIKGNGTIQAVFRQTYKSNRYSDVVKKILLFTSEGHQWKIVAEVSVPGK